MEQVIDTRTMHTTSSSAELAPPQLTAEPEQTPTQVVFEGAPRGMDTLPDAIPRLAAYLEEARQDPEQRVLYEEQVTVMEDIYRHLEHYGVDLKGRVSLPTGVGKTVLLTEFVRATGLRTLVVTPSRLLVDQTVKAFGKFAGDEEIIVGKVYSDEKNGDAPITITTYSSFAQHTEAKDSPYIRPENYDVIILDEAHHAMSEKRQNALAKYPGTAVIGLTATEDYSRKKRLSNLLPHAIHKMTIREAVESKLISPYSVIVVETETDMSSVKISTTNEYDQEDLQRVINSEARNQVAAEIYIKYFMGKKVVFSCGGIQHAKDMAKLLQDCGVPAEAIYGGMSKTRRNELIDGLADQNPETGLMVLCNDKLLAEGFDEPSLAACFNLVPTLSKVRSQQRSGRALRLDLDNPDKHALIVEFTDQNYRKPPVLFADPEVAGAAHLGSEIDLSRLEQTFAFNVATARVTTDPELVEQLALTYSESRKEQRPAAPEDWLTISAIIASFNVPGSAVQAAMHTMREHVPEFLAENSGKFLARGVRDGITTYYSPAILEGLEILIKQPEVAPESWLTANQVAALYGFNNTSTLRQLKLLSSENPELTGKYVSATGQGAKKLYFSPECVKEFANRREVDYYENALPPNWITTEELGNLFGPNASKKALEKMDDISRSTLFSDSRTVDDVLFLSPKAVQVVSKIVTPPKGGSNIDDIAAQLNADPAAIQDILNDLQEEIPKWFEIDTDLCWVEGQEVYYYKAFLVNRVKKKLEEIEAEQASEAQVEPGVNELIENEVVLIPHFELSKAPVIDRDPLGEIEFGEVIKVPPRRPSKYRMNSLQRSPRQVVEQEPDVQQDATSPQPPVQPAPTQISYLGALKRFKR